MANYPWYQPSVVHRLGIDDILSELGSAGATPLLRTYDFAFDSPGIDTAEGFEFGWTPVVGEVLLSMCFGFDIHTPFDKIDPEVDVALLFGQYGAGRESFGTDAEALHNAVYITGQNAADTADGLRLGVFSGLSIQVQSAIIKHADPVAMRIVGTNDFETYPGCTQGEATLYLISYLPAS